MLELVVSPIYVGLTCLLMAVLATRVAILRGVYGVALGNGGAPPLALAIRHFGNLSEYAAAVLLLLVVMELTGVAGPWLHAYGLSFLVLRLVHPFVLFSRMDAPFVQKVGRFVVGAGTAMLLVIGSLAVMFG
ncbi:MAG: MAPEG family protein [Pseudomonadota bacterium]